jgi:hypothetical protein
VPERCAGAVERLVVGPIRIVLLVGDLVESAIGAINPRLGAVVAVGLVRGSTGNAVERVRCACTLLQRRIGLGICRILHRGRVIVAVVGGIISKVGPKAKLAIAILRVTAVGICNLAGRACHRIADIVRHARAQIAVLIATPGIGVGNSVDVIGRFSSDIARGGLPNPCERREA